MNGLTAKNITKCGTTALAAGDLALLTVAEATLDDGTQYQPNNPQATACAGGSPGVTSIELQDRRVYVLRCWSFARRQCLYVLRRKGRSGGKHSTKDTDVLTPTGMRHNNPAESVTVGGALVSVSLKGTSPYLYRTKDCHYRKDERCGAMAKVH